VVVLVVLVVVVVLEVVVMPGLLLVVILVLVVAALLVLLMVPEVIVVVVLMETSPSGVPPKIIAGTLVVDWLRCINMSWSGAPNRSATEFPTGALFVAFILMASRSVKGLRFGCSGNHGATFTSLLS
jgi:hypothetical protein